MADDTLQYRHQRASKRLRMGQDIGSWWPAEWFGGLCAQVGTMSGAPAAVRPGLPFAPAGHCAERDRRPAAGRRDDDAEGRPEAPRPRSRRPQRPRGPKSCSHRGFDDTRHHIKSGYARLETPAELLCTSELFESVPGPPILFPITRKTSNTSKIEARSTSPIFTIV